jgi:cytochrome c553
MNDMLFPGLFRRYTLAIVMIFGLLAAGITNAAWADDEPMTPEELFKKSTCVACHGKNGAKARLAYPNIAGQNKEYMIQQMKDITAGARVSGPDPRGFPRTQAMQEVMVVIDEEQMQALADWLSGLPPAPPVAGDPELAAKGAAVFAEADCADCHGEKGLKPLPNYPIIAGQKKNYIALQLKEIRDGVRVNNRSKRMARRIDTITDEKVDQLAEYLSQIDRGS